MNALKQLQTLYDQELYSNVIHLAEMNLSILDQKPDVNNYYTKYEVYMLYADSLYHTQQYLLADSAYSSALQIRKYIAKMKTSPKGQETTQKDKDIDINIKYKMYLCRMNLKMAQKAIDILQTVPARIRIPKVNMALGDLYMEAGLERSAATCYKEVLRESSCALLAAEKLLKLGIKGIEVNSLMLDATTEQGWIHTWLRGQSQMQSKEYQAAIDTFKSIDSLKDNINLLVTVAYCYVYLCDEKKALHTLQHVTESDQNFITGRDLLATLLAHTGDKDLRELERLATIELEMSRWSCEHWIVMGWYMYASKKYEKALYFGHQALLIQKNNVEALLLKAHSLMVLRKHIEALFHFKDAMHHSPNRYEAHKGLVECNFLLLRVRESLTIASNACKVLNNSPQALTLYASVIMKDPTTNLKVKNLLDKALADNPTYTPAICLLAEYYEQEQRYEEACQMLQIHVDKYPSSKIHQLLADNYARIQKDEDAFTHYNAALRLDPRNQRALEGLNSLGRSPSKLDTSYNIAVSAENNSYSSQCSSAKSYVVEEGDVSGINFMFD